MANEPLEYFVVLHVVKRQNGRIVASIETPVARRYLLEDGLTDHKLELDREWNEVHDDIMVVTHSVTKL